MCELASGKKRESVCVSECVYKSGILAIQDFAILIFQRINKHLYSILSKPYRMKRTIECFAFDFRGWKYFSLIGL